MRDVTRRCCKQIWPRSLPPEPFSAYYKVVLFLGATVNCPECRVSFPGEWTGAHPDRSVQVCPRCFAPFQASWPGWSFVPISTVAVTPS